MVATPVLVVIAIVVLYLLNSIKILREYERGVIFRLGRALPTPKGPGVILAVSYTHLFRIDPAFSPTQVSGRALSRA